MTTEALQEEGTMEVMVMVVGVDMEDEVADVADFGEVGVGEGSEEGGNINIKISRAVLAFVSQIEAFW